MRSQETSECLRRLLRGRELYTCMVYRWTLVPWLLYVELSCLDELVLEGLIDGYRWRRWPRLTFRWRPSYR